MVPSSDSSPATPERVGIIGQGYVGLPLALLFARKGISAVGFDLDEAKVAALNAGKSFIRYIADDTISDLISQGLYRASSNFDEFADVDALIICVPTPLNKYAQPDISFIQSAGREIAKRLNKGQLVVLESTTYPGCTKQDLLPILEESGLKHDVDFWLAFSPEREDPANAQFKTDNIPKLVGGLTPAATRKALDLYQKAVEKVVPVDSAEVAEAAKLLENIFRSVNIALVNEMKIVFDRMGVDVWKVVDAARTKPFGFMPFYPGPGLGGHCIPIDPFYLTWKAKEYGLHTRFIELAGEINTEMPTFVVSRVSTALNHHSKPVKGSRILIVGLAYKANVEDTRESPAFAVISKLRTQGGDVSYFDPYVPESLLAHELGHGEMLPRVEWNAESLANFDAAVIVTNHSGVDYTVLAAACPCIVDTRNALSGVECREGQLWKA